MPGQYKKGRYFQLSHHTNLLFCRDKFQGTFNKLFETFANTKYLKMRIIAIVATVAAMLFAVFGVVRTTYIYICNFYFKIDSKWVNSLGLLKFMNKKHIYLFNRLSASLISKVLQARLLLSKPQPSKNESSTRILIFDNHYNTG